ncbi:MAG: SDR family oxidoreductase [candidate division Zixibacteria bacterium]|nr:SDR family oxidoreductase [candidate division Zixibacteria bacterium]
MLTGAGGTLGIRLTPKLKRAFGASAVHCCYHSSETKFSGDSYSCCGDLTEKDFLEDSLKKSSPQVIINLASLTDVNHCEEKPEKAQLINVGLVEQISEMAPRAKLVQISTDYVFDGESGNYKPNDKTNPISVYGITKLAGESATLKNPDNLVIRTSGLFDSRPGNLFYFFMDKLKRSQEVSALSDCWYSPTSAVSLAESIVALIENNASGVIHFAGPERVTRYDFALLIAESLGYDKALVKKMSQSNFNWPARRPRDSSLDSYDGYSNSNLKHRGLAEELGRIISIRE